MTGFLGVGVGCLLAYANGANDNFKGVATLFGSGQVGYRRALGWATVTTFGGALAAAVFSRGLLRSFSGQGLVPPTVLSDSSFALAVGVAAATAVLLATRLGLPVSTTHALIGALVGAGAVASPAGLDLHRVASSFLVPLLAGPALAVPAAVLLYALVRRIHHSPPRHLVRPLNYASAGVVSFARGLNDAPKIAAVVLLGGASGPLTSLLLVATAMAAGGLLQAHRVAQTMSHGITSMDDPQALSANLATGSLVVGASWLGLPMSTTHVACGSLIGIGTAAGRGRMRTVGAILAAWVTTLPLGALLGAAIYAALKGALPS